LRRGSRRNIFDGLGETSHITRTLTVPSNGFCVLTIRLDNFKGTKIWTIVVTSRTNGYFDW